MPTTATLLCVFCLAVCMTTVILTLGFIGLCLLLHTKKNVNIAAPAVTISSNLVAKFATRFEEIVLTFFLIFILKYCYYGLYSINDINQH